MQSIHRIGRPPPLDLERADRDSGVLDHREATHSQAMLGPGVLLGGLVGRDQRRHQQHPLKTELIAGVAGDFNMPEVRRVERPAKDSE